MRKENLLAWMANDRPMDEESLSQIEDLLDEYPYFQAGHLLYLLNLQTLQDTRQSAALRRSACYLNDLEKLFFLTDGKDLSSLFSLPDDVELESQSSFDLIDAFLSEKFKGRTSSTESDSDQLLTTDYLSYLIKEDEDQPLPNAPSLRHQEVIDKFIEADSLAPIKITLTGEQSDPEPEIAELDSIEEEGFFSETLAKIYLKQKKYEKALEIIRQLNLLYPEKNVYFADQIRFLEKLIINKRKTE